jgi:hypothetical protein
VRYYNPAVVRSLIVLSQNRCGYTGCAEVLSDPSWKQVNAEIAHISGERPGAPRYDQSMTEAERTGLSNLLVLCPNHHSLVDSLLPEEHPTEKLKEMKQVHEAGVDVSQPWARDGDLDRFAQLLMERAGSIMIDWLSGDDSIEVSEVKVVKQPRPSKPAKAPRSSVATKHAKKT